MRISFQQIEAFVTVAEMGNFSAAAKQLKKDRSTLSQIVKNLEIDLGYDLFSREGRYPSLTEQGLALYDYAKRLSTEALSFESIAQRVFNGVEEQLNVALSNLLPSNSLIEIVKRLRKQYPHIKINWLHDSTESIKQQLLNGGVDIGIVVVAEGKGHSSIEPIFLHNLPLIAVKSPSLALPQQTRLAELAQYRQLIAQDLSSKRLKQLYAVSGQLQLVHCTHLLLALLEAGEGWAFLPEALVKPLLAENRLEQIVIKEESSKTTLPISVWSLPDVTETPVKDAFIHILTQVVNDNAEG
jgi:DNA-binding transcriptional LysR family regulator